MIKIKSIEVNHNVNEFKNNEVTITLLCGSSVIAHIYGETTNDKARSIFCHCWNLKNVNVGDKFHNIDDLLECLSD